MATNYIRIEQEKGTHWAVIVLTDAPDTKSSATDVKGTWVHTNNSYSGKRIEFTSDNPEYYYFRWNGTAGKLVIGSLMNGYNDVLMTLDVTNRSAGGFFSTGVLKTGTGTLTHNVNKDFTSGNIEWRPDDV